MKKNARKPRKTKSPISARESDKWLLLQGFCQAYSLTPLVQNSYVLSRFWAWFCQIEVSPQVRIPIPRVFTQRDP